MFNNYLKIAWRNILKHRLYSFVNVVGLFTGILFSLLIGAYVWSELRVNKDFRNASRQYLLKTISKDPNLGNEITTFAPLAKRLKTDYPNLVANYYRWDGITSVVSKGEKHLREGIALGDSTLLMMYGFEMMTGDTQTALKEPFSVVITAKNALKYFGKMDVVGETLNINNFSGGSHDFKITGVIKDLYENTVTYLNGDENGFFIPTINAPFFGRNNLDNWANFYIVSFVELKEGVVPTDLDKPIKRLVNQNADRVLAQNFTIKPVLLSDFYLQKGNGFIERMLYVLSFVGLFILLMAIVNFINIAISSAGSRTKEIGVRKVLGGSRSQLILQFLAESTILVFISTTLAVIAYPFSKALFSDLLGKQMPSISSFPITFIFIPILLIALLGVLAGFYPAFVLSSMKTVDSIKGKLTTVQNKIWLRKSLAGFQFCMALVVLISAGIITQQIKYFFGQSLGYDKEYVVSSQVPRDWTPLGVRKMLTIRDEFASMPQISHVSLSYEIPNGNNGGSALLYKLGTDSSQTVVAQSLFTDENYLKTYQIQLKSGEFFDNRRLDSGKVVLNEIATKALGFKSKEEAIGKQLRIPNDRTTYTIKGIISDFHFASMQQTILPVVFFNVQNAVFHRFLSFKIKSGNVVSTIEAIQAKWAKLMPGSSFEYTFMDDTLKKMYTTEIQLKKAAYLSTLLSLIIAFLGVLGLVSLSIQKRVKEIGVRKILGASNQNIVMLFVKEFMDVIIIASLIACPIAFFVMNAWLNNYAYRIQISPLPFALAIVILVFITLLLIGFQAIKAAVANPVKSLRTE
jgi:putative ABC transport system permease protein